MLSRRHLFGLLGGAAVAPMFPVPAPIDAAMPLRNVILTPEMVTARAVRIFRNSSTFLSDADGAWYANFNRVNP